MPKKAVVLLSGGLDSATAACIAKSQGFGLYALTLTYGQTHACEVEAAKKIANFLGVVEHRTLHLPLGEWGGSALVNAPQSSNSPHQAPVQDRTLETIAQGGIPATYVPARNTIFLSLALGWAEVLGAEAIFIGVNALDYSGYPDCRPEFIAAFERLAQLATKSGVEKNLYPKIHAPLLQWGKAEIIKQGTALGLNFALTHSCYFPAANGQACGRCDSCLLRLRGFADAGLPDPLTYQPR